MHNSRGLISNLVLSFGLITILLVGGTANGAIILDHSPLTTGATISSNIWTNILSIQSFADDVNFISGATVTGIDIYSSDFFGAVGQQATVRLWADNSGQPGVLLDTINTIISSIDDSGATDGNNRIHADITSLLLAANTTYWIGMTGTTEVLTQTGLLNFDDSIMAQFNGGSTFSYFTSNSVGDMAFRLEGEISSASVPEPSSFILLGAGLAGMAFWRKKRS
jgi:hypothetical protein